ncbi:MAG: alpha/beta hydrolase [Pirellulaceae bacterium]|nr:alpha/beta hydrolase [Pirellulaceae bacterium]
MMPRPYYFLVAILILFPWSDSSTHAEDAKTHSAGKTDSANVIWLISSRHLPSSNCHSVVDPTTLQFTRLDEAGSTVPGNLSEFEADGVGRRTCIYVHGNRVSSSYAAYRGLRVYRKLECQKFGSESMRFVIWSWPSDRVKGLVRDARVKAARTDSESFYLASVLETQPENEPLSLIGFSFGGPIISGALHLLAGGAICGCSLDLETAHRLNADVVLMAPAMGNRWLSPSGRYGLAAGQIERLLLLYNSRDRALKQFWVISSQRPVTALGYRGFDGTCLGELKGRIRQCDVSRQIGREHTARLYLNSGYVSRMMENGAMGQE